MMIGRKHILHGILRFLCIYIMWGLCASYAQDQSPRKISESEEQAKVRSSDQQLYFDEMKAFHLLTEMVKRGQRYYGAPMRAEAIAWLSSQLAKVGAQVSSQSFEQVEPKSKVTYTLTNIIGRLYPKRRIRVLLGSHWDTRLWAEEDQDIVRQHSPITGANDGSSGLAVLVEVARQIKQLNLAHIGIDLVFFDGEEFGRPGSNDYCAGSKYFAKNMKEYFVKAPPVAVIVIDMVGDQNLAFPPEKSSAYHARDLTRLIWSEGLRLKLPAFINGLGGGVTKPKSLWIVDDHSPFQALGIPATLIIDLDYPHWHTHQDTLDKVSPNSLKQTGLVLLSTLKKLDLAQTKD